MSDAQPITMVEMENRLADDVTGAYRDDILNRISQELSSVKRQIDGGLVPAEFAIASALRTALESAEKVVTKFWSVRHGH